MRRDKLDLVRNLLGSLDLAMRDGRVSAACRRGLVRAFVQNTLLKTPRAMAAFTERHGHRPPRFLTVSPGKSCNLRCTGCYAASGEKNDEQLDFATMERIIDDQRRLWGSFFTVISGGEPLMWKSGGRGLLELAALRPDHYFLFYTNGTLIDDALAARISSLGNLTPAISVEGLAEETDGRRGRGTHARILRAMATLRRHGVPFGVSMTALRGNAERLLADEVVDFYFAGQGAIYAWLFHYMPLGRERSLELMMTPRQRVSAYRRVQWLIRQRGYFFVDFWNGGPASRGCISAGRPGGYFAIDWSGSASPCVFNPYHTSDVREVFAAGGDLDDVLFSPFFRAIRRWQREYAYERPADEMGNLLCQCAIRDHAGMMRELLEEHDAHACSAEAADPLDDEAYWKALEDYGAELEERTRPIWEHEYLGTQLSGGSAASRRPSRRGDLASAGR